jgi:hypothetical protein
VADEAQPARYTIRVRGVLSETLRTAFPELDAEPCGKDSVLTGVLPDQAALYGVLTELEALGIELIDVSSDRRPKGNRR